MKTLGQVAYEAYFNAIARDYLDRYPTVRAWDNIQKERQVAWEKAASAVKEYET